MININVACLKVRLVYMSLKRPRSGEGEEESNERTLTERKGKWKRMRKRIWREAAAGRSVCLSVRFGSQFVCFTTRVVESDLNFDLDLNLEGEGGRTSSRGMLVQFSRHGKGWRPANGKADEGTRREEKQPVRQEQEQNRRDKDKDKYDARLLLAKRSGLNLKARLNPYSRDPALSGISGISDLFKGQYLASTYVWQLIGRKEGRK
ncbi:hypothetical protein B0H13DRAFT_1909045 [Mycena leptocephala]|nr:hypothetical protein B0H13DRAFT_1909045 [Mycena leptocephala]